MRGAPLDGRIKTRAGPGNMVEGERKAGRTAPRSDDRPPDGLSEGLDAPRPFYGLARLDGGISNVGSDIAYMVAV